MSNLIPLKVLILEDNAFDAEIIVRALKRAEFNFQFETTDNETNFLNKLNNFKPDIILSDYSLPSFTGLHAIEIIKNQLIYIPLIIITGSLNEEIAADCIKSGAYDYILKDNIKRLPYAIKSALEHKKLKEEKENALLILTQNEENFRLLAENSTDIIWKMNKDLKTIYISPSILGLTGFTQKEHLNQNLETRFSINSYHFLNEKIIPYLREDIAKKELNKIYKYELEYNTIKGNTVRTEILFKILTDKDNNFIGVQGSTRSIEERKLNEEAIIKSESKYRLLANNITDVIFTADMNMNVNYISPSVTSLLGFTAEEIIKMNISQFLTPESIEKLQKGRMEGMRSLNQNPSAAIGNQLFELEHICKNGETIWTETSLSLIWSSNNFPTGVVGVIRNINERKIAEKQIIEAKNKAEEANKLKSNFLANMSHEIRTPLNGILGFAELLKDEISEYERIEMANVILRSGNRLKDTLNAILDISAIEAGFQSIYKHPFDIQILINDILKLYEESVKTKNLEIKFTNQINEQILSDDSIIYKIINNLIDNAIKFTENGEIEISTAINETKEIKNFILLIKDSGIGIDKTTYNLIFEDFRQVSEGKSRTYDGNGLGLSIAKRLVNLLEGSITVESELGKGSLFTVIIPLSKLKNTETNFNQTQGEISKNNENFKSLLLLVEDDETNALLALSFLKKHYKIDIVYNGYDAINIVQNKKYDAILMDINLGVGINGIETVNRIKTFENYKDTPVAAVTAHAMKGQEEEFLCKGCTHYLAKPYSKEEIIGLIKNMLKE